MFNRDGIFIFVDSDAQHIIEKVNKFAISIISKQMLKK